MAINLNKLPRKWLPLMAAAAFIAGGGLFLYSNMDKDKENSGASIKIAEPKVESLGVGSKSEAYRQQISEDNDEKASKAEETGKSYFPVPTGEIKEPVKEFKEEPKIEMEEPEKEEPKKTLILPVKKAQRNIESQVEKSPIEVKSVVTQAHLDFFANAMEKVKKIPQSSVAVVETPYRKVTAENPNSGSFDTVKDKPLLDMNVGDILYVRNDVYVNSNAPGTPVMATVLSGKYFGAKVLGKFTASEENLIIIFDRLSHNGTVYDFEGYAVNAEDAKAGVASNVNTHFFERWASLIASSFLEGFGEAVGNTGSYVTHSNSISSTEQIIRDYSFEDQAWIAAGKVGEKMGDIALRNFDKKPTITLNVGQDMGMIVLKVGR